MEKKDLVKLALAGLVVGLTSTQPVSAEEFSNANSPTTLAAHSCGAGSCGGASKKNSNTAQSCGSNQRNYNTAHSCGSSSQRNTADANRHPDANHNFDSNRNPDSNRHPDANRNMEVKDDFRDSLDEKTKKIYRRLDEAGKKEAWEMVNKNSRKNPNEAVREVAKQKGIPLEDGQY